MEFNIPNGEFFMRRPHSQRHRGQKRVVINQPPSKPIQKPNGGSPLPNDPHGPRGTTSFPGDWMPRRLVVIIGLLAIGIVFLGATLYIQAQYNSNKEIVKETKQNSEGSSLGSEVIHYYAVDRSESALRDEDFQKLEHKYCESSKQQYYHNDVRIAIEFADTTAFMSDRIDWDARLRVCSSQKGKVTSTPIGETKGTSLINLLNTVAILLQSERSKGEVRPAVITILVQHAEPGQYDPISNLSPDGLKLIKKITLYLTQEQNAVVVLITKVDQIVQKLRPYLKETSQAWVCEAKEINFCLQKAFMTARTLPK